MLIDEEKQLDMLPDHHSTDPNYDIIFVKRFRHRWTGQIIEASALGKKAIPIKIRKGPKPPSKKPRGKKGKKPAPKKD